MPMQKLSSDKVAEVLRQVGPTLRALSEENSSLKEKLAFYHKRERVEKLATSMEAKNLNSDTPYAEKVDRLMQSDDLDTYEKAVELSAQQVKLASLSDHPGNASDAASALEQAILEG